VREVVDGCAGLADGAFCTGSAGAGDVLSAYGSSSR
jgi:hypothetical protein